MKYPALLLTILGITFLILLQFIISPRSVSTASQLSNLSDGQHLTTSARVTKQSFQAHVSKLTLDNGLTLSCTSCPPDLLNKKVTIIARVDKFQLQTRLEVLSLVVAEK